MAFHPRGELASRFGNWALIWYCFFAEVRWSSGWRVAVGLPIWRSLVRSWSLPSCFFLRQETYSILSLFTQVYKWEPAIIMLGVGAGITGLASHPGRSTNIPNCFMLQKPEISPGLMGQVAHKQPLPLTSYCILMFFSSSKLW